MSTEMLLQVRDLDIQVVRKAIKNLHVAVYPPDGHVRVAAPAHMDDDAIRLAVIDKLTWIRRQRRELRGQLRQSQRELVEGESHYVWGQRYRLQVEEPAGETPHVELVTRKKLLLVVQPGADLDSKEKLLADWYRRELRTAAEPIIRRRVEQLSVELHDWRIRRMRTKWGSCNPDAGRIWLNLELAKKSPQCLDYVIVHELLHLVERQHSARFEKLLDATMPGWRTHREELYRLPLGHEEWPARRGSPNGQAHTGPPTGERPSS
jgi:predicted metal-dependent hydrolase